MDLVQIGELLMFIMLVIWVCGWLLEKGWAWFRLIGITARVRSSSTTRFLWTVLLASCTTVLIVTTVFTLLLGQPGLALLSTSGAIYAATCGHGFVTGAFKD